MKLFPSKRRLKRIGIGLGIVVGVLFIVNGIFALWTERQWQNRLAAIRAAGDPASIADLAPASIPDEQNAAAILKRIDPTLKRLQKAFSKFSDSEVGKNYEEMHDRGEPPTEEQIRAIKDILKSYEEVTTAVDEAVATNHYASQLDYSLDFERFNDELLESSPKIRAIARYYDWKMRTLVADERNEEAVLAGLQLLRLTRLYESEPTLVNHLITIACRGIAISGIDRALRSGPITPETRKALDDELALHDDPQSAVRSLKTERAFSITSMEHMTHHVHPALTRLLGWPIKRYYIGVLDFYDVQLGLAAEPWYKVGYGIGHAGVPKTPSGYGFLADTLLPARQAAHDAFNRGVGMVRALQVSTALAAFREEHGREAEGLHELLLPKEAVTDPFSGVPLIVKHTDEGWIIYSVYRDGVDGGGDFRDLKDFGLAPPGYSKGLP